MSETLQKVPFTPEHLGVTQAFYCGDEPWEIEVSDWIKGKPGGVIDTIRRFKCEVWLYVTPQSGLIGFGSLGRSNWEWPTLESPRQQISIIPMLGIQKQFMTAETADKLAQPRRKCFPIGPEIGAHTRPSGVELHCHMSSRNASQVPTEPANYLSSKRSIPSERCSARIYDDAQRA